MERPLIQQAVRDGLARDWSPEQIAGRLKQQHPAAPERQVSAQTIYTWIDRDPHAPHWKSHLRRRGKRPHRRPPAEKMGAPLANRPAVIERRERLGDFEGDTVLGPPGTGGLATLVCRRSRFTILTKVRSKESNHVHRQLRERLKKIPPEQRHSLTFDNGTEFARCHRLEPHLNLDIYFADPGCPYQRGTNENTNGLIRQYFPKGTDFRTASASQVQRIAKLLNNRPRACLGFRTPAEVFLEKSPRDNCD
jgi:IS30 family transposase